MVFRLVMALLAAANVALLVGGGSEIPWASAASATVAGLFAVMPRDGDR